MKTTEWIISELKDAGYKVDIQEWGIRQFDLKDHYLKAGDKEIECYPVWYPKPTGEEPIKATVAPLRTDSGKGDMSGKIATAIFSDVPVLNEDHAIIKLVNEAAEKGAVAVVGKYPHKTGKFKAYRTAFHFDLAPWPVPVMVVGDDGYDDLKKASESGTEASLLIDGNDNASAPARNIIGRIERGDKWIIVSAPKTGWFNSATGSGTGVSYFLNLARWAARLKEGPSWMFIATSGNEMGDFGTLRLLNQKADIPAKDNVICWLGLGESMGARRWKIENNKLEKIDDFSSLSSQLHLTTSKEFFYDLVEIFKDKSGLIPEAQLPGSDMRPVMRAGYKAICFWGKHDMLNSLYDTPECTSPGLMEPTGKAIRDILEILIKQ
jgi:hypothetical protein